MKYNKLAAELKARLLNINKNGYKVTFPTYITYFAIFLLNRSGKGHRGVYASSTPNYPPPFFSRKLMELVKLPSNPDLGTLVEWRERSPPSNVTRAKLHIGPYVGWAICCWFSSRVFFPGAPTFPPLQKPTVSKFQFDQDRRLAWKPAKADGFLSKYRNLLCITDLLFHVHTSFCTENE